MKCTPEHDVERRMPLPPLDDDHNNSDDSGDAEANYDVEDDGRWMLAESWNRNFHGIPGSDDEVRVETNGDGDYDCDDGDDDGADGRKWHYLDGKMCVRAQIGGWRYYTDDWK